MPRRNLYVLVTVLLVSLACYYRADSAHRNRYAPMFDTFVTALSEIRDRYLYQVDERKLFEGAMKGMVDRLDPYSGYAGEEETREFRESLEQEFGGIGIEVSWDRDQNVLTVLSPIVGTPAYEKGILPGDRILKINDESTEGMTMQEAVRRLRGKPGDPVRLSIVRDGESDPHEIEIRRAIINVDTVLGDYRLPDGKWSYTLEQDPTLGYLRITQFGEKTVDEMHRALAELRMKHIRGLILDLRSDPGGLLTAAQDVCDQFIQSGVIVSIRDREHRERERYEATGKAEYTDWPMTVLVNRFSASASEIVAACLQDHERAVVIGERTWGKGTVQTPIELENGKSLLRLTIAGFWRPSGKNIHRTERAGEQDVWGVSPNVGYDVKVDEKKEAELAKQRRQRDVLRREGVEPEPAIVDPVMQKAIDYLKSKAARTTTSKAA